MLKQIFQKDPEKRPTMQQLLKHPFLAHAQPLGNQSTVEVGGAVGGARRSLAELTRRFRRVLVV